MRLSRTAWLVLGIGIFIIAFATLYTISSGQSGEKEQLSGSLAKAQALLPKLIAEREDLAGQLTQWEEKLAEVTSSLSRSEARFPKSVESIEYDETLFKIADDCDLQIVEITASEPGEEKAEDIIYTTTTFEVKVRGKESPPSTVGEFEMYIDDTVANMLDFINAIATSEEFNVGTIELVDMEKLEPPEEVAGDETGPEATIKLIIYGFPR
jgi:hypothetical protein